MDIPLRPHTTAVGAHIPPHPAVVREFSGALRSWWTNSLYSIRSTPLSLRPAATQCSYIRQPHLRGVQRSHEGESQRRIPRPAHHIAAAAGKHRRRREHLQRRCILPDHRDAAYQASKAGVKALARGAARDELGNDVRITSIPPGVVHTPFLDKRPVPPPTEVRAWFIQPGDVATASLAAVTMPGRTTGTEITHGSKISKPRGTTTKHPCAPRRNRVGRTRRPDRQRPQSGPGQHTRSRKRNPHSHRTIDRIPVGNHAARG